jgi:Protein of unknown function (DUF3551)
MRILAFDFRDRDDVSRAGGGPDVRSSESGTSWGGSYYECSYTSLPQCNASASGRSATCVINPYYAGAGEPAGYRRHRRVY